MFASGAIAKMVLPNDKVVNLYEIWQTKKRPYALVDVISALIYYRDELVSIDYAKLDKLTTYLNEIADEDQHYEIRVREVRRVSHNDSITLWERATR